MAKKENKGASGEQQDLIDVAPENAKPIIAKAKKYKEAVITRVTALDKEVKLKKELLDLVHDAGLKRLANGNISFTYDGFKITVTPRDDLIKVEDKTEE